MAVYVRPNSASGDARSGDARLGIPHAAICGTTLRKMTLLTQGFSAIKIAMESSAPVLEEGLVVTHRPIVKC